MTEEEIRKIVQDELKKNYTAGVPRIPPHSHDGIDGLRITSNDLSDYVSLPTKVPNISMTGLIQTNQTITGKGNTPVTIVTSGVAAAFNGGTAADGTIVLHFGASGNAIWVCYGNSWYHTNLI